jgi:hypothetical protein
MASDFTRNKKKTALGTRQRCRDAYIDGVRGGAEMVTVTKMEDGRLVAEVVLANGKVVGAGLAMGTRENAVYFACKDAALNGYVDAANGNLRCEGYDLFGGKQITFTGKELH